MDETHIAYAGIAGQAELHRARHISAVELTQTLLDRIERVDPTLNAHQETTILAVTGQLERASPGTGLHPPVG